MHPAMNVDGADQTGRAHVIGLLRRHGLEAVPFQRLGDGLDHDTYEADGGLVVRVPRNPGRATDLDREARFLRTLATVAPLPTPAPLAAGDCLIYPKLPGVPLLGAGIDADPAAVGATLGRLLAVLHGQLREPWADLVDEDATVPATWLEEAAETYADVAPQVPPAHRPGVEAFLASPPPAPATRLVLCHNDLGAEHVLVDPATGAVTGVIDWSDAAIADPARDLGLIHRDLGPAGVRAALETCAGPAEGGFEDRALFFARCGALEDLAYGLRTGRAEYSTNSLRSFGWLFPPQPPS